MAVGVFVPVALRRRAPMVAFGGLLVLAVLLSGMAVAAAAVVFIAAAYVLYTVTLTSSKRTGVAALGLVLVLMVIITTTGRDHPAVVLGGPYAPVALANVLAWTVGYSVRQRRLYVIRLQQQAASSAVADERLRIARELHDVVAHSMSVIAVQAGYGQYVIDDSPDGAREALGAIQVTSREALDEMRRMLGVLRAQDTAPAPGPGLTDQPVTEAGLRVDGDDAAGGRPRRRHRARLRPRRPGAARARPGAGQPRPADQAHLRGRGAGRPGGLRAGPPAAGGSRPVGLPDHSGGAHQRGQARGQRRALHGPPRLRRGGAGHPGDR